MYARCKYDLLTLLQGPTFLLALILYIDVYGSPSGQKRCLCVQKCMRKAIILRVNYAFYT